MRLNPKEIITLWQELSEFLKMLKHVFNLDPPNDARAVEALFEAGMSPWRIRRAFTHSYNRLDCLHFER